MTKKTFALFLVVLLLAVTGLFAGGNQAAGSANDGAVRITATYAHFGGIPTDTIVGKAWHALMEQKTGQKLDIVWNYIPYAEYAEKINVILATNDLTDLTFIMSRSIAAPYEGQGVFVNLAEHWAKLPAYNAFLKQVPYGMEKVANSDGTIYGLFGGETPRLSQGVAINATPAIRYDVFQRLGIKVPGTVDEVLDAARKLKAAYPGKYPVHFGHGWWALSILNTYKTSQGIYWDGSRYVFGPLSDNYRAALTLLNRLYTEGLLDPESFTDNDDTRTRKALNGDAQMLLGIWFNTIDDWNTNTEANVNWALIPAVSDPAYGTPWQSVQNENEYVVAHNGEATYIKAGARNLDTLLKIGDASYDPETIRLISWGIEGQTYTVKADGTPTFMDNIRNSPKGSFWIAGDDWGMRASSKYRPGLQGPIDARNFLDCAPPQNAVINGQFVQTPYETAFPDEPWPTSPWISPNLFAPPIAFTPDENNANSSIMTAVNTYVTEETMKFITGERNFNQWNAFTAQIRNLNIQTVLDMYNRKAAPYK
ncbi:MAG: extracellular solute-binding protein [Treponema sp.]|jgi:putative aldouronate transport system substrate-binding protein|nr:extracellular solute-binding protein [Treponema sp.]